MTIFIRFWLVVICARLTTTSHCPDLLLLDIYGDTVLQRIIVLLIQQMLTVRLCLCLCWWTAIYIGTRNEFFRRKESLAAEAPSGESSEKLSKSVLGKLLNVYKENVERIKFLAQNFESSRKKAFFFFFVANVGLEQVVFSYRKCSVQISSVMCFVIFSLHFSRFQSETKL